MSNYFRGTTGRIWPPVDAEPPGKEIPLHSSLTAILG
jgi:hypothetical protein